MLLNKKKSRSKSVNNATAKPISQTPAWALAYSTVKPSLTISPWTIDIHVQTYHPLLATFLKNSRDIHDSFSSVHPQFIYHLMWKSFMFEYVKNEIVCPRRTRRRTVSRGAIVRKKASRDQYESATAHA